MNDYQESLKSQYLDKPAVWRIITEALHNTNVMVYNGDKEGFIRTIEHIELLLTAHKTDEYNTWFTTSAKEYQELINKIPVDRRGDKDPHAILDIRYQWAKHKLGKLMEVINDTSGDRILIDEIDPSEWEDLPDVDKEIQEDPDEPPDEEEDNSDEDNNVST